MANEIERKFLVNRIPDSMCPENKYKHSLLRVAVLEQGYLSTTGPNTSRIRIETPVTDKAETTKEYAYLTVKGKRAKDLTRPEFEYEVPASEGKAMLKLCKNNVVKKERRSVKMQTAHFEILVELDIFRKNLKGLVMVEVEFPTAKAAKKFQPLEWMGKEVTEDKRYTNKNLAISQQIPEMK